MEALLLVGLLFICAGIIKSVHEEWAKSGLTDTSFLSLALWVGGLAVIAVWGVMEREQWVAVVAVLPALLFLYWIALKLRDQTTARRHGHRR